MKLQRLTIADATGQPYEAEGFVFGVWAGVRVGPAFWTVTHLPTGLQIGDAPHDCDGAQRAAERLSIVLPDWGSDRAFADATPVNEADAARIRAAIAGPQPGSEKR